MSKVRIGFVGVGDMGQIAHLKNYVSNNECEVVAISEIRPKLAGMVSERYGVAKIYPNYLDMIKQEKPDAIVASQQFVRHSILLPELYKHVKYLFTEKPLCMSEEVGQKLVAESRKCGCTHMVGYHKRSDPATMYAKSIIDDWNKTAKMGRLQYVRVTIPEGDWIANGYTDLIRTDETVEQLEIEQRPDNIDEKTWRQLWIFVNFYVHQVNLLRHLMCEPYKLTHVEKTGKLLVAEGVNTGLAGIIELSPYKTVDWEESALVAFEHGYVQLTLPAPLASNRAGTVELVELSGDSTARRITPIMPRVHAMRQQAANFIKVCRGEMAPPCDAVEAAEDLKICGDYINRRIGK